MPKGTGTGQRGARWRGDRAPRVLGVLVIALVAVVSGCANERDDRNRAPMGQVEQYFGANNAAARTGPAAQRGFFQRTQHPDFPLQDCDLGAKTVEFDPAVRTLRPDPGFASDGIEPRGQVWVVAVEVTTREHGTVTGRQIGSQHLVALDGKMYGFAPCSTS